MENPLKHVQDTNAVWDNLNQTEGEDPFIDRHPTTIPPKDLSHHAINQQMASQGGIQSVHSNTQIPVTSPTANPSSLQDRNDLFGQFASGPSLSDILKQKGNKRKGAPFETIIPHSNESEIPIDSNQPHPVPNASKIKGKNIKIMKYFPYPPICIISTIRLCYPQF